MRHATFVLVVLASLITSNLPAETNYVYSLPIPRTKLEAFELKTGTVLVKASSLLGTVAANRGTIAVTCKEDKDVGSDIREYGIAINLSLPNQTESALLLDYDELEGLLKAVDYLNKLDWTVTSLASFGASFESKAGFRIVAFSSHRSGAIQLAVRNTNNPETSVLLGRDHLAQFRNLIEQAKAKIEELMKDKNG